MSDTRVMTANLDITKLVIPAFGIQPAIALDVSKIYEGEARLSESQFVNPATYSNLEYVFNEGYREAKRHIATVGYQLALAEKALREAKSVALLDEYPEFLKKHGHKDSAQIRDAFLERQVNYVNAQDRIDMLKSIEALMDGKVKSFENVCRYMRKEMDLVIRSGVDKNKYIK